MVILCFYRSHPSRPCGGLDGGDSIVVLLGGGHGNRRGQVLGVVAGGGEDCPLFSGVFYRRLHRVIGA